jgi:hypothetical protein
LESLSSFTNEHYEEVIHPLLETLDFKEEVQNLIKNTDTFLTLPQVHHFNNEFLNYSRIWMSAIKVYNVRSLVFMRLIC